MYKRRPLIDGVYEPNVENGYTPPFDASGSFISNELPVRISCILIFSYVVSS
jgi:hypothetical protein